MWGLGTAGGKLISIVRNNNLQKNQVNWEDDSDKNRVVHESKVHDSRDSAGAIASSTAGERFAK